MDALQDFVTTVIIVLEYLFLGYIALAFMVFSFERQAAETGQRVTSKPAAPSLSNEVPPLRSPVLAVTG